MLLSRNQPYYQCAKNNVNILYRGGLPQTVKAYSKEFGNTVKRQRKDTLKMDTALVLGRLLNGPNIECCSTTLVALLRWRAFGSRR